MSSKPRTAASDNRRMNCNFTGRSYYRGSSHIGLLPNAVKGAAGHYGLPARAKSVKVCVIGISGMHAYTPLHEMYLFSARCDGGLRGTVRNYGIVSAHLSVLFRLSSPSPSWFTGERDILGSVQGRLQGSQHPVPTVTQLRRLFAASLHSTIFSSAATECAARS